MAHSESVYKSVDQDGNVTYSQEAPSHSENTREIKLQNAPTSERVDAARQRHERNQQAAEIMDENRQTRDQILAKENKEKAKHREQVSRQNEQYRNQQNYNHNNSYPYYPPYPVRRPGYGSGNPGNGRPVKPRPLPGRPAQLPAR